VEAKASTLYFSDLLGLDYMLRAVTVFTLLAVAAVLIFQEHAFIAIGFALVALLLTFMAHND
jgi:UDP-N-acetylmuramyl pentapeptide phosphotransferase/UDP-N-acetylglucosamine-1-phosphate transferase